MRSRSAHVRTKVVALLLSLAALWGFAAFVTLREGLNLLWANTLNQQVGFPTDTLITALQDERRLSLVYLGDPTGTEHAALAASRTRTDQAVATFNRSAGRTDVGWAESDAARRRVAQVQHLLTGLGRTRSTVDIVGLDQTGAAAAYTGIIDAGFQVYGSLATFSDEQIAAQGRTLVTLTRCRELLSQEDAMLSGVLARGRFAGTDALRFTELVGAQRFLYTEDTAQLPSADRARYQRLADSSDLTRFRALEDLVLDRARTGSPPPVSLTTWRLTLDPVLTDLRSLERDLANATVSRATAPAAWVIIRLALAGGLGLIAVIASVVMSITTARSLIRQLDRLRAAADELASRRLPAVVERLRRGEDVDVAQDAPPLEFGRDEIGQVGHAFNAVQETAVRAAVDQAELRRSVRDVFLSLARRSQALVHRQLGLLDSMERRAGDAEELADLFRVDHLATRMRRNAENLIVLSGAVAGRGWRHPVPMVDVVRGALAEVEDYTRVTVLPIESAALTGRAVGDVIHLLAEMIENAVSFSPPYTTVHVSGAPVANGFVVEIEDRGLGMTESDLVAANEQLAHPPEFNLTSTARLGLYVVGRLAERHGIRVRLRESPYGGTTAIVLIPATLMVELSTVDSDGGPPVPASLAAAQRTRTVVTALSAAPTLTIPSTPPEEPNGALPGRRRKQSTEPGQQSTEPAGNGSGTVYTPAGLPWRVRQASLSPSLRAPATGRGEPSAEPEPPGGRAPEEIRRMMSSYQTGTQRGRVAADPDSVSSPAPDPGTGPAGPTGPTEPAGPDE